jgi:dUTP pyrophosphatase
MPKRTSPAAARLQVMRLPHGEGLDLPAYKSTDAAGMDLVAAVPTHAPIVLAPGAWIAVPTGLALALPRGTEGQVRPRSGLALRHGVTVLNSPGTIDADYRGEVQVLLINHGRDAFEIRRGDRIAQLIVAAVLQLPPAEVSRLDDTARGAGGFGSTGVRSAAQPSGPKSLRKSEPAKSPASATAKRTRISKSRAIPKRGAPKGR